MKNLTKLKLLLDELSQVDIVPDIILLCETFTNKYNIDLVNIPGYEMYYKN